MKGCERINIPLLYRTVICILVALLNLSFSLTANSVKTGDFESSELGLNSQSQDESLKILSSGTDKIELALLTPEFSTETVAEAGKEFQRLSIKGYGSLAETGKPQLPMRGFLLAIPEDADITVKVLESEIVSFSGLSIYPLATSFTSLNPSSDYEVTLLHEQRTKPDDSFYPGKLTEIGFIGYLREVRVVQLYIYPVQYNSFQIIRKR